MSRDDIPTHQQNKTEITETSQQRPFPSPFIITLLLLNQLAT